MILLEAAKLRVCTDRAVWRTNPRVTFCILVFFPFKCLHLAKDKLDGVQTWSSNL